MNDCSEARGFWSTSNTEEHITYKKLKVARCAIQSFLPKLIGRRLLSHEKKQYVIGVLTHLASRSPAMMCELQKLFLLIDEFDIKIRTTCIRSAADIWADGLSRIKGNSDWKLKSNKFGRLNKLWGPVSIDRFVTFENKQYPRYNAKWGDGRAEAVNCLHLSDDAWYRELSWCNPPWELLDDLASKLRSSRAAAIVIAPEWPQRPWFAQLSDLASETMEMPSSYDLFSPQH